MSTIGEILAQKYTKFLQDAKTIVGDLVPFPSLDEIDLADLFVLLEMVFPDMNTQVNLRAVLVMKGISLKEDQINQLVVLIDEVLIFLKSLKK